MADDTVLFRFTIDTRYFHYDALVRNDFTVETEGGLDIANVTGKPISREAKRWFWTIFWSWIFGIIYFWALSRYCQPPTDFSVFLVPCSGENAFTVHQLDNLKHEIYIIQKQIDLINITLKYNITSYYETQLRKKLKSYSIAFQNLAIQFKEKREQRFECYKENSQASIDNFRYFYVIIATSLMVINYVKCFYFIDKTKEEAIPLSYMCAFITILMILLDIHVYRSTVLVIRDFDRYVENFPIANL